MHFNNLLLGFRLKALGGITIGATIAVSLDLKNLASREIIAGIFVGLAVIWVLIGIVDFFYYYRLLAGAVDELLCLEQKLGNVWLSHQIEWRAKGHAAATSRKETFTSQKSTGSPHFPSWPIRVFYAVPLLVLIYLSVGFASGQWFLSLLLAISHIAIFILGFVFGRWSVKVRWPGGKSVLSTDDTACV